MSGQQGADDRRGVWRARVASGGLMVAVALTSGLGLWQLRRANEKATQHAALERARAAPPLVLSGTSVPWAQWDGRRVLVQGVWESTQTFFLDNRTHHGVAGFYVLTPLRLTQPALGDVTPVQHVLVLRGWVPRDPRERTHLPIVPTASAAVQLVGLAQANWPQPRVLGSQSAQPEAGGKLWQALDLAGYPHRAGLAVAPLLIRQTSALPDGLVREWAEPGAGVAKHQAYALQWFAMAVVLLGYGVWGWWRRRQQG